MSNEITKLYSLAGVEKEFDYLECHRGTSSICCPLMDNESERDEECEGCVNSSKMQEVYSYPPFTAEKQIEIIKWLAKRPLTIDKVDGEFEFSTGYKLSDFGNFEESLAELINNLWQDLTESEQNEIREILR